MPESVYSLTPRQRTQLRALWAARATSGGTARQIIDVRDLDEQLLALLERMGLVTVYRPRLGALRYFLTPAGVAEARKPSEARNG